VWWLPGSLCQRGQIVEHRRLCYLPVVFGALGRITSDKSAFNGSSVAPFDRTQANLHHQRH